MFIHQQVAEKVILIRRLKNAPASAEAPALRKASGGGATRRQAGKILRSEAYRSFQILDCGLQIEKKKFRNPHSEIGNSMRATTQMGVFQQPVRFIKKSSNHLRQGLREME
jgi:hypothetical protein